MKKENKLELLTKGQLDVIKLVFKEISDNRIPFETKDFLKRIQKLIMFKNAQMAVFEDVKKKKVKLEDMTGKKLRIISARDLIRRSTK